MNKNMFRFFDVVISVASLVVFFSPMVVFSIFIYFEDRGPIFFFQNRVGQYGKVFPICKFRTMTHEPGRPTGSVKVSSKSELLEARRRFKTTNIEDSRVTKVGRILRKAHLDELPQLWNVLLGDMSIVGVRPDTPSQELDYQQEYWLLRHRFKPGITGFAQIESDIVDLDHRSRLELKWINNRTVTAYFFVVRKTFLKILQRSSF